VLLFRGLDGARRALRLAVVDRIEEVEPAEIVDAHWLFANHVGAASKATGQLVCRLPSDDPWMQNMLRPIVEAAGYRVVGSEDAVEADLVIASVGAEVGEDSAGRTIWLRSDPDTEGKQDNTVYRYDRAGLLMALKSAAAGRGK
jgi:two-component system chemotaxis sensor kinase CheA